MPKVSKKESGYVDPLPSKRAAKEGTGLACSTCYYYSTGKCGIVSGRIDAGAACNLYSHDGKIDLRYLSGKAATRLLDEKTRLTKAQAGFIKIPEHLRAPMGKGFQCSSCTYWHGFISLGGCFPVEGVIPGYGCCNVFTPKGEETQLDYASGEEIKKKLGTSIQAKSIADIEDLV